MAKANPKWQAGVKDRYDEYALNFVLNGFNGALAVRKTKGYGDRRAKQTAVRLGSIGYIKERIAEIKAEIEQKRENTRENVTIKMFELVAKAEQKGDLTNAVRIYEDLGKNCGWFAEDNAQHTEQDRLTEEQVKEAKEYAKWKLLRGLSKPQEAQESA